MDIKIGDKVLSHWNISDVLGSGAYGTVYKLEREEFGQKYFSALKVVKIPPDREYISSLKSEGMTNHDISNYIEDIAKSFMNEIKLLEGLKGNSNIVCYEDHLIEQDKDNLSYTIMIRMELLTPLKDIMAERVLYEKDIIKIGIDMCKAIEICENNHIIHRDIKPDNIFCSQSGEFKLGDFGVARTMEKTVSAMSQKGTYTYMAPEIFMGKEYDKTVDLYSLGIVLYQLLNKNRTPFLPDAPNPIKYSDRENAQKLRMSGVAVPDIDEISEQWNNFFKIALAFKSADRFQNAKEMKDALKNISALDFDNEIQKSNKSNTKVKKKHISETVSKERKQIIEKKRSKMLNIISSLLLIFPSAFIAYFCDWVLGCYNLIYTFSMFIGSCFLTVYVVNKLKNFLPKPVYEVMLNLGIVFFTIGLYLFDFMSDFYYEITDAVDFFYIRRSIVSFIICILIICVIVVFNIILSIKLDKEKKCE